MATALITGASSGIGEHFAYALARAGYYLVLCARREERLRAVAQAATRLGAAGTLVVAEDLARRDAPARVQAQLASAGLSVELLINNAGFGTSGFFHQAALGRELEEIDLNIAALVMLTRLCLPAMVAARAGTIVNVASTAAFQPVPYMASYAATKAFVLSFSQALRAELRGTGINVLALCPGLTRTEFQQVAGTERAWVPAFAYMDAEVVVAQAMRAIQRRRAVYVNGALNRLSAILGRISPQSLVTWVGGWIFRPGAQSEPPKPGAG